MPVRKCCSGNGDHRGRTRTRTMMSRVIHELSSPRLEGRDVNIMAFDSMRRALVRSVLSSIILRGTRLRGLTFGHRRPIFVGGLRGIRKSRQSIVLFSMNCNPSIGKEIDLGFKPLGESNNRHHLGITISHTQCRVGIFSALETSRVSLGGASSVKITNLGCFLRCTNGNAKILGRSCTTMSRRIRVNRLVTTTLHRGKRRIGAGVKYSKFGMSMNVVSPGSASHCVLKVLYSNRGCQTTGATQSERVIRSDMLGVLK